ncbi:MAG: hypothetical protein LIO96_06245 [Lachnospiraceae bacterium]|nr:hypothetical protein [Lachnospiraceae bacterium]
MNDKKYVQLPPLAEELGADEVGLIWLFTKMSGEEKEKTMRYLDERMAADGVSGNDGFDPAHIPEDAVENCDDGQVPEFVQLIRKLASRMMREACRRVSDAYLNYCLEGRTADDLDVKSEKDREYDRLLMKYFDEQEQRPVVVRLGEEE